MPNPRDYFTDPAERLIAETSWAVAGNPSLDAWQPEVIMSFWTQLPQTHNQIVLARAWTTETRETPHPESNRKDGGVYAMRASVARVLGVDNVKVTSTNIANVEHFYSSALITTVVGLTAGPALAAASSVVWELVVGPYALVAVHAWNTDKSKQDALATLKIIGAKIVDGLVNNYSQVTGPDQRGIRFAFALGVGGSSATQSVKQILNDYYNATNSGPPRTLPKFAKATKRKYRVSGGESLSLLAKWFYQGEMWRWPVIYDRNRAVIGGNYNRLREGIDIDIPLPWEMTAQELATARIKHQEWNKEGRW